MRFSVYDFLKQDVLGVILLYPSAYLESARPLNRISTPTFQKQLINSDCNNQEVRRSHACRRKSDSLSSTTLRKRKKSRILEFTDHRDSHQCWPRSLKRHRRVPWRCASVVDRLDDWSSEKLTTPLSPYPLYRKQPAYINFTTDRFVLDFELSRHFDIICPILNLESNTPSPIHL